MNLLDKDEETVLVCQLKRISCHVIWQLVVS